MNQRMFPCALIAIITIFAFNLASPSEAALTWSAQGSIPSSITDAMNAAVADFNAYSDYSGNIVVTYNPGVPTAQTDGYRGLIEFGGSINQRVAEHEISHWLGTGTYGSWNNFVSNGQWTGAKAKARVQQFDGPSATIGCDSMHYWPYGANYDNEPSGYRHIAMVGALLADMGLTDTTKFPYASGTYRIQNRGNGLFLDNMGSTSNGTNVCQWSSSSSSNQRWRLITLGGGYYKLQCVTGNGYLDSLNNTADGSVIGQWASSTSWNQQWALTPSDSGYFNIVCRATGKCVDDYGSNTNGAAMVNWGWWFGNNVNQQWRLVP